MQMQSTLPEPFVHHPEESVTTAATPQLFLEPVSGGWCAHLALWVVFAVGDEPERPVTDTLCGEPVADFGDPETLRICPQCWEIATGPAA